jgi:hypothetical protein
MPVTPGVRRSLTEIQAEYDSGDKEALETLMRAWRGIKDLPADDPRSFFMLGGYHGEPFRDQGATDPAWWGGLLRARHGALPDLAPGVPVRAREGAAEHPRLRGGDAPLLGRDEPGLRSRTACRPR